MAFTSNAVRDTNVILLGIAAEREIRREYFFFFSSRRRHTRLQGDWSSDVCSSDLDLDVVLDDDSPGMGDLHVTVRGGGVAEAVRAQDRARVDDDPVSEDRARVEHEIGRASCRERV